jgi:Zn finger protein HypA/HybF involved in hydrogenase expression
MPESPEVTARAKYACPSCGAEAQWNPAKHALVCPFCGTVSPAKLSDAGQVEIHENDLLAALKNVGSAERGLQAEKKAVKCQSCQAISLFDPKVVAQRCEFCGSTALIPIEQQGAAIRPESLLEFKIAEAAVRDSVHRWYSSVWFAPSAMKQRALTDTVRGIYLPYWTFDAQVHADWTAESGYYYYETETFRDSQGREQTRQVQQTRWSFSSGSLDHFFDDELVPASKGVPAALLKKIEPFPTTTDLKPYDPGYLSGWTVEQYQIDLVAAAQAARTEMDRELNQLCAREVPGDTHRNLSVNADYSGQTFKHILVPVWVLAYVYGAQHYQVVINGYTGKIAGKHPLSWIKITLAVLAALVLIVILIALFSQQR